MRRGPWGGRRGARVLGGGVEGGTGEVEADGALGGEAFGLDAGEEPQRLGVAFEAAAVVGELVQRVFAVVAEGRVAEVVGEAGGLHEVGVAAEGCAQLPADLGALQGVGEAGAGAGVPGGGAALAGRDDLGFTGESPERGGVQYAGAVALEGGAAGAFVGFGGPAVD